MTAEVAALVCALLLLANLGVLGLTVKLYSEYAKDMSQRGRRPASPEEGATDA